MRPPVPALLICLGFFLLQAAAAQAQDRSDHVRISTTGACTDGASTIDISLAPLGKTQIPGPPGITTYEDEEKASDTEWLTPLPHLVTSTADYFPEPPVVQLSYRVTVNDAPPVLIDFAYCPTADECLFTTEKIDTPNYCN